MASAGNPNQQGLFDMNKFFKPSNVPYSQNPSDLGTSSPFPSPVAAYGPTTSASYPPPTFPYSFPPQTPPFYNLPLPQDQLSNLHHQRSLSFPTPSLQPTINNAPVQNPNPGARLMALLSGGPSNFEHSLQSATQLPSIQPPSSGGSDFLMPVDALISSSTQPLHTINAVVAQHAPMRMLSSKLPKGRHLVGDHVIYDVDVRMQGEVQPQLEVTPITKYVSDPGLILGHQIAVNKTYICYGLKLGAIRVLDINTALRSLLRGHSQRVTDMAFFAEDVHLLASASIDGWVYIWMISEGPDEEDKTQILGNIVTGIHVIGEEGSVHPRVCWHCHKQEILVVAVGKSILRIDTTKVGKGEVVTAEEPLICPLDKLIDGIQFVGKHDGEVTDLSMCQWMTTRLVSASKDGTIKIWEDRKAQPLLVMKPHDGQPVDAAIFLTAPHRPDHIVLVTAGPQNREVKVWASSSEEGWLLPIDAESWRCIQTLEFKSSLEPRLEEAFFNQVVGLSQLGLLLLANAKKNAIYALHLEYGANPFATRMDYLAEFTVTMPILSFTGTSDILSHGEHIVQVYCVQTQAIQQYALDLSQCLPPPMENSVLEKLNPTISHDEAEVVVGLESSGNKAFEVSLANSAPKLSNQTSVPESTPKIRGPVGSNSDTATSLEISSSSMGSNSTVILPVVTSVDVASITSPSSPSPRLLRKLSNLHGDLAATGSSVDRQMDNAETHLSGVASDDGKIIAQGSVPDVLNPPVMFKHPTHLITPSEIMAMSSPEIVPITEDKSEGVTTTQDVLVHNDLGNIELDVKVVDETGFSHNGGCISQEENCTHVERKEKSFGSQASDDGADLRREYCGLPAETSIMEEAQSTLMDALAQPSDFGDDVDEPTTEIHGKSAEFSVTEEVSQILVSTTKGKKLKGKTSQASGSSFPSPSISNSADSLNELGASSSMLSLEAALPQILEMLNQLVTAQKEMQKQMTMMIAVPVTKEGKRLEAALGRSMEKAAKANADALWARIQEENAKNEKLIRDRTQQIITLVTNFVNKDLLAILDKTVKKELAAVGATVARVVTPVIEKAIPSAVAESFQRAIGDKAVNQLDRSISSKIEATVARHIQAQFQTSGRQALQDGLKSVLEASIIPAFEMSCKAMFEQVDTTFQKSMAEHTAVLQHEMESTHSPLALALRDAINSASSVTQSLSGELADGQRKLLALAAAGASSKAVYPLVTQPSERPLAGLHEVEQPFDPMKELSRLISEHKFEEAFTAALQRSDVSIVSWLCSQVDLPGILSMVPLPLSQGVLLSLLQQLSCDISKDTPRKLAWMIDVAVAINPADAMIAMHVRPIFEQVYQILNHHRSLPSATQTELSSIRLVMHVINSMLMACK
ncbi:hypothetical protein Nepgr_016323 [Nepenthes gracilis]|uniref:Enhancer of mRNA-decapping protein 4 WD40 repeat region domain-containing protein n=1 Tax=Nepenthes gracilis TaxID=150966 RepID=A0AAD3SP00_NEPGR|nr:hypothetical protein Nepgr_016323 [Nepenthes gracilis]